jgi:hypothetical protein
MKFGRILLLAAVCLRLTSPAAAQLFTYCGQLSDADCALMRDGAQSLDELRSVAIINASMRQYPLGSAAGTEIAYSAQGKIAMLPGAGSVMDFRNLGDLNADLSLALDVLSVPEDDASGLLDMPEHNTIHVRVVNGDLYVDMESLVPALEGLSGWARLDLSGLIPTAEPTTVMPTPTQTFNERNPVVTGADVQQLADTFDAALVQQFVTVARTGDEFSTRVDFAAMYAHPDFQAALREQLDAQARYYGTMQTVTDDELALLAGEMAVLFPEPMTLYTITVDPITRTVRGIKSWGMLDFSTMVYAGASGTAISQWSLSAMEVSAEFADYNVVEMVTAPENAQTVTIDMLSDWPLMRIIMPG